MKLSTVSFLTLASFGFEVTAQACATDLVTGLVKPQLTVTQDNYQMVMRRPVASSNFADDLLLYDALYKELSKDLTQLMALKAVVDHPVVTCDGFRIIGISVRRENVTFFPATRLRPQQSSEVERRVSQEGTTQTIQNSASSITAESIEQLIELWQSGKASREQLHQLWSLTASRGEKKLQAQLFKDMIESMRQQRLPPLLIEKKELPKGTLPPATAQQLKPALESKSD